MLKGTNALLAYGSNQSQLHLLMHSHTNKERRERNIGPRLPRRGKVLLVEPIQLNRGRFKTNKPPRYLGTNSGASAQEVSLPTLELTVRFEADGTARVWKLGAGLSTRTGGGGRRSGRGWAVAVVWRTTDDEFEFWVCRRDSLLLNDWLGLLWLNLEMFDEFVYKSEKHLWVIAIWSGKIFSIAISNRVTGLAKICQLGYFWNFTMLTWKRWSGPNKFQHVGYFSVFSFSNLVFIWKCQKPLFYQHKKLQTCQNIFKSTKIGHIYYFGFDGTIC